MGFMSFSRAPIWSRLFKVAMVIWYILAAIMIVAIMAERPWELTHGDYYSAPSDYNQWSPESKAGATVARTSWIWVPALLVAAPWLFLLMMRLLRNTAEYIVGADKSKD